MYFKGLIIAAATFCCMQFPQRAAGQIKERLQQVKHYLDSTANAKVDQHYIEVPEKPWRVVLQYKETDFNVDYNNTLADPSSTDRIDWLLRFEPPVATSVGLWVGYQGTGLAVAKTLGEKTGTYFSFSSTGAKYGLNLRLRSFETDEASLDATYQIEGNTSKIEKTGHLAAPVKITSVYLNGYYVFNGRRYSQAAAYNQSVIQRHSAGSFLLGATIYKSSFDFSDPHNAMMIFLSQGVARIKLHQANLGIGYGYNWVPLRGLVVNMMAMPTISFYNRVKVYNYELNYDLTTTSDQTSDYGAWNAETHTWANGAEYRPIPTGENDKSWLETADAWEVSSESEHSPWRFNLDLRLGIAYNWSRYFIGAQAQLNRFSYKKDNSKVTLIDAYARLSLGVRL